MHFTMNSIKMDYEQGTQNHLKKINQLKKGKNQVEESLEEVNGENLQLNDQIQKLKQEI